MTRETSYGREKRIDFLARHLRSTSAARVLEVGCGTGSDLSRPLAERFPDATFDATDADATSVAFALAQHRLANLRFGLAGELEADQVYDVVIASEVIEHVEDPVAFLRDLRSRVRERGSVIVTTPNGWGPFEVSCFLRDRLATLPGRRRPLVAPSSDTLAVSPHISFFRWKQLHQVFRSAGLRIEEYEGRTFVCGPVLDRLVRGGPLLRLNASLGGWLPARLVSDWMFVLRPASGPSSVAAPYERGRVELWRRRLSERSTARSTGIEHA